MSLIHFAVARSRLPAWLALLAMLLLFIAPVISKSLMAQRGYGEAMMHHASGMMMMHGEMMMHDASGMMPHEDSALTQHDAQPTPPSSAKTQHAASSLPKHHPMSMMDDSACGYCVLLIHLSIDSVRLPELWTLLQAAIPAAPLQLQPFVASWTPLWFRPRGPPVNAFSVV
ncbi:MAG: DUF2946 domain-containing protein [Mixta calida]|uniref:DUF2946 domain-containing protein n=1 Tax=Mixta calida TaxID=665913 RepID=UPI00053600FD|nr:DUF2946 domain-containing protein [Mixta calida]AIX74985.1 hypothetical protein PSNIH2_15150 [Pantoea sp. PSNIH2]KAF0858162.1 hypothetical protein Y888_17780 [Mixta calida B021323]MDU2732396.1 DUF2946 domain-containing protein [Mixta calida]MDU4288561.1 DUF2946 domain-containing protein [Mixta calida]MDU5191942.1 DUF2946 domain-containing protein [Mixta calida]